MTGLSDAQMFGAPILETGEQPTPEQAAYAAAMANVRDPSAPAGSPQNPAYDTPSRVGGADIVHVGPDGRALTTAEPLNTGLPKADGLSDAEMFSQQGLKPDFGLGLYAGAVKPADNAASGLRWLADKAGLAAPIDDLGAALGLPSLNQAKTDHQAFIGRQAEGGIRPGPVGKFVGEVAGSIPATIGAGPLVGGALTGALLSDAKDLPSLAWDTGFGAVGGKGADMALNGIKGMVAPHISDAVRTLLDSKVGLTPGQIMGGAAKRIEDGATSIPIFGDIIKNAQARGMGDFNRAAINRSLEPIGATLPDGLSGYEAVDKAHELLGGAYDALLPGLKIKADPTFGTNLTSLNSLAKNLDGSFPAKFSDVLRDEVLGKFAPKTGMMTGETMKEVETTLGQIASKYGRTQDVHAQDYADAIRQLQSELRSLVARNNPPVAARLRDINQGYSNLVRVENASGRLGANGGVFTPAQLDSAVRAGDNSVRKNAYARGNAQMQDLSTAGKEVLPSSVPDSGSPFRHALEATVALLVGQEAHALPLMLKGAAAGGALGAAYTRGGQKIVTPLLTERPASAESIADLIAKLKTPAVPAAGAAMVAARQSGPQ